MHILVSYTRKPCDIYPSPRVVGVYLTEEDALLHQERLCGKSSLEQPMYLGSRVAWVRSYPIGELAANGMLPP